MSNDPSDYKLVTCPNCGLRMEEAESCVVCGYVWPVEMEGMEE